VTTGQTLDPETEFAQPLTREVDLPVFKRIFIAAAHQERELIAISLEERRVSSHQGLLETGSAGPQPVPSIYPAPRLFHPFAGDSVSSTLKR